MGVWVKDARKSEGPPVIGGIEAPCLARKGADFGPVSDHDYEWSC